MPLKTYGMTGNSPGGQFNYPAFTFPGPHDTQVHGTTKSAMYYHHQLSLQEDQGIDMTQSPSRYNHGSSGSGSRHSTAFLGSRRASECHLEPPHPRCSLSSSSVGSDHSAPVRVERLLLQGIPDQDVVHGHSFREEDVGIVKLGHQKRILLAVKRGKDRRAGKPREIEASRQFFYTTDIVPIKTRGDEANHWNLWRKEWRETVAPAVLLHQHLRPQTGDPALTKMEISPPPTSPLHLHEGGSKLHRPRGLVMPSPLAKIPATFCHGYLPEDVMMIVGTLKRLPSSPPKTSSDQQTECNTLTTMCDLNIRLVFGMRVIGKGFRAARSLCGILNIPAPPKVFSKYERVLGQATESVCNESMRQAVTEAIAQNCNEDRKPTDLCVALDGSWQ
ncbi:hypothetical protein J6590_076111 [Homalodisca vitripennis]|nr:hypothetical protein J6590_076111 [Homalodisca vitripennis]